MFYSAFYPQFLEPGPNLLSQLILLSLTFVSIAALHDCCWAFIAGQLRPMLAARGSLRNKLTGAVYIAAAIGLALSMAL